MSHILPILPTEVLLPCSGADLERWAVVACDQYTSQPDYWQAVEAFVGDAPSALRIVFPEIYLSEMDRIALIQAQMKKYLQDGTLVTAVESGFVLVERSVPGGVRPGLVAKVDLENYNFDPAAGSLVRATEGTILSRIPPRVKIRQGALLESTHVMVLIDDPKCMVIEPLQRMRNELRMLYDFDLMQGGGHICGYAVENEVAEGVQRAFKALMDECGGLFAAVGDGNHSLATARQCWLDVREGLSQEERAVHPARYALIEVNNLHTEALQFEPIHRVLFDVDAKDVMSAFEAWCIDRGYTLSRGTEIQWVQAGEVCGLCIDGLGDTLPVAVLQSFLDQYLKDHPSAEIDYIHGEDVVGKLSQKEGALGVLLTSIDKSALFPAIKQGGVLPRKTFSMGEAFEKRYYLECRRILNS